MDVSSRADAALLAVVHGWQSGRNGPGADGLLLPAHHLERRGHMWSRKLGVVFVLSGYGRVNLSLLDHGGWRLAQSDFTRHDSVVMLAA